MDPAAIAETTVEMWVLIDAKLTARSQQTIDPEIKAMMLKEAMALYITNVIKGEKSVPERSDSTEAPRKPSEKQLKYIADLGGNPDGILTAAEASKEIERLKGK